VFRTLIVASLLACASPVFAQLEPPTGMVWRTSNGLCQPSAGDIDSCSFGPSGSEQKTAIAYYRICGQIHEAKPFLIADLQKKTFTLDRRNGFRLQVWPFPAGTTIPSAEQVATFADMVEDGRNLCLPV
jgi:hypothetical protein